MPSKSPIAKIKDTAGQLTGAAVVTVVDTGQKVVGQAIGQAAGAVGAVTSRVPGRRKSPRSRHDPESSTLHAVPQDAPTRSHGDPVKPAAKKAPAKKAAAKKLASAGRPEIPTPDETALGKKTATKKTAAKKTAAKKTARRAPTKKSPGSGRSPG
ncbi:hypothetical protein [Nocardioides dilutus]